MGLAECMATAQIIASNPVLNEPDEVQNIYFWLLYHYVKIAGFTRQKYVKAQIENYKSMLVGEKDGISLLKRSVSVESLEDYRFLIPLDYLHVLGYDKLRVYGKGSEKAVSAMCRELNIRKEVLWNILYLRNGNHAAWRKLSNDLNYIHFQDYLNRVRNNVEFMQKHPEHILVTATMSAGKSTFINALTGKKINRSQNMACTAKVHSIIAKPFEDGMIGEVDYDFTLNATQQQLMEDHTQNNGEILVNTYFSGQLGGKRVIIEDSPGVNYSVDVSHKVIAEKKIASGKYDLVLFVLDATQLHTDDMKSHLEFVQKHLGRRKILFVLNKIDGFNASEDDFDQTIKKLTNTLEELGYKQPVICPVSARAAVLAKQVANGEELSRYNQRVYENEKLRFEEMNIIPHEEYLFQGEVEALLERCGMSYVEKKICEMLNNKGGML